MQAAKDNNFYNRIFYQNQCRSLLLIKQIPNVMKTPKNKTQKAEVADQKKPKGSEPENNTSAKDAKKVKTTKKS